MTDTVGFLHSGVSNLVDALLSAGTKKIRGITRSSSSKKAKDLAAKGVEVVEAKPRQQGVSVQGTRSTKFRCTGVLSTTSFILNTNCVCDPGFLCGL